MTTKLRVITNSERSCFRRCQREHHYAYGLGYRALEDAEALRFGSLWHLGLEQWWLGRGLEAAIAAATAGAVDPYEAAKLRVLLRGYDARWSQPEPGVLGVELEFRAPLINPGTGAASRTFEHGGKMDVLLADSFAEHKTTSEEIGLGSSYWRRLMLDPQVSTYYAGARAHGVDPQRCIYDVVRKPQLRPLKATPEESRKYTKDGRLYAAQRDRDETAEEYELRLAEDICGNPDKYYQRGEVVRLEAEEREAQLDAWQLARAMRDGELAGSYPRNPDSCLRYGRTCAYFDVCTGTASLDDEQRFERVDNVHPELSAEAAE